MPTANHISPRVKVEPGLSGAPELFVQATSRPIDRQRGGVEGELDVEALPCAGLRPSQERVGTPPLDAHHRHGKPSSIISVAAIEVALGQQVGPSQVDADRS